MVKNAPMSDPGLAFVVSLQACCMREKSSVSAGGKTRNMQDFTAAPSSVPFHAATVSMNVSSSPPHDQARREPPLPLPACRAGAALEIKRPAKAKQPSLHEQISASSQEAGYCTVCFHQDRSIVNHPAP